jgi:hypothetical protein
MTVLRDHTESCIQLKHLGLYMGLLSSNHCNALDLVLDRQYNSLEGSHGLMDFKLRGTRDHHLHCIIVSDSLRSQSLGGHGAACGLIA